MDFQSDALYRYIYFIFMSRNIHPIFPVKAASAMCRRFLCLSGMYRINVFADIFKFFFSVVFVCIFNVHLFFFCIRLHFQCSSCIFNAYLFFVAFVGITQIGETQLNKDDTIWNTQLIYNICLVKHVYQCI